MCVYVCMHVCICVYDMTDGIEFNELAKLVE